jgi:tRNA(adenine34) deaminase
MTIAFVEAEAAAARGEVPVGAVLVEAGTGTILARAGNRVETDADPTSHAEILVLRAACGFRGRPRLPDCDLYVTLEPCAMCAAAIAFTRIRRMVFAADDPKGGAVLHGPRFFGQPTCHHRPLVERAEGAERAADLLRSFFRERRRAAGDDWRDRSR